jgi:hypothetical protein
MGAKGNSRVNETGGKQTIYCIQQYHIIIVIVLPVLCPLRLVVDNVK